jgi:hypothetical protein
VAEIIPLYRVTAGAEFYSKMHLLYTSYTG